MATTYAPEREKTIDLPPFGPRNADPLTDAPGSHPIETGVGAALAGAASGAAVGMVTGPIGTAVGATVGAIAGGLAGKGIGELIDPTMEDEWLRERFADTPTPLETEIEDAKVAYRYGVRAEADHPVRVFTEIEDELQTRWDGAGGPGHWSRPWRAVKDEVRAGFEAARAARVRM
jgi:hypothetical protein